MNEQIYYALKGLGVRDAEIAEYLAEKTGRTKHSWQVKLSNGVALTPYRQNNVTVEEFRKYGMVLLEIKYAQMLYNCLTAEKILRKENENMHKLQKRV